MKETKGYTRCLICRRRLKNPKFKILGMGDVCFKKFQKKQSTKAVQMEMNI